MSELDNLIKRSLKTGIDINETDCENSYIKFKDNINNRKITKYPSTKLYMVNLHKAAVIAICSLVCIASVLVIFSKDVKAVAIDALNNVKMLFVPDRSGGTLKIVQKPSSEVMVRPAVNGITGLDDNEIGELIGYQIRFPDKFQSGYELYERYLLIKLNNQVPYDERKSIERQMEAAIYDQEEFNRLSDYAPVRGVMGIYKYKSPDDKYGTKFSITSYPQTFNFDNDSNAEDVKIGNIQGYWYNIEYIDYPPFGDDSMTHKPSIINDSYGLNWTQNGISYTLQVNNKLNLNHITKETAIALAKEFIEAQPK